MPSITKSIVKLVARLSNKPERSVVSRYEQGDIRHPVEQFITEVNTLMHTTLAEIMLIDASIT